MATRVQVSVGLDDVPVELRRLVTLVQPDYADAFSTDVGPAGNASALQWARAALEDAAGLGGQLVWRGLLGLRLQRGGHHQVAGWAIAEVSSDRMLLTAASWLLSIELAFRTTPERVAFGTFVQFQHRAGELVWRLAAPHHRRAAPGLLRASRRALSP